MSSARRSGGSGGQQRAQEFQVLFDPAATDTRLFDELAERQVKLLPSRENSSQVRRFFGEVKELYRQFTTQAEHLEGTDKQHLYEQQIEPRFKMIRSKVRYACPQGGGQRKISREFADLLSEGIRQVNDHQTFERFVNHLEAVVGFMYGLGKVSR